MSDFGAILRPGLAEERLSACPARRPQCVRPTVIPPVLTGWSTPMVEGGFQAGRGAHSSVSSGQSARPSGPAAKPRRHRRSLSSSRGLRTPASAGRRATPQVLHRLQTNFRACPDRSASYPHSQDSSWNSRRLDLAEFRTSQDRRDRMRWFPGPAAPLKYLDSDIRVGTAPI